MTTTNSTSTALARQDDFFPQETVELIRRTLVPDSSNDEFMALMEVAKLRRLNPLLKQIHFVKRKAYDNDSGQYVERWAFQVGIDGIRAIAQRTGEYNGQDEPEFECAKDGSLIRAKVRVYRKGVERPFVGVADWVEFAQKKRDGSVVAMWRDKPRIMLSKVAEFQAFRRAFPEDTSGFYAEEEFRQEMVGEAVPTLGGSVGAKAYGGIVGAPKALASAEESRSRADEFRMAMDELQTRAEVLRVGATIDQEASAGRLLIEDRAACLQHYMAALRRVGKARTSEPPAEGPKDEGAT